MLKVIRMKNFPGVKFLWFRSICEKFLTVDDCNMDKRLENSCHLVCYQVSGEPESCRLDIYLGGCGVLIHWLLPRNLIFRLLNFRSWSRARNYFNSKIFPTYGIYNSAVEWSYFCLSCLITSSFILTKNKQFGFSSVDWWRKHKFGFTCFWYVGQICTHHILGLWYLCVKYYVFVHGKNSISWNIIF